MIYSPFSGNFGNNLMAFLIARIAAEKNGYDFGFNRHPDYDYFNHYPQLDFFSIDYGKEHNCTYHEIPPGITNVFEEKFTHFDYPNGDYVNFYHYQPEILEVPDNTKIIVGCCQDARYFRPYKEKIKSWLKIKPENIEQYEKIMKENNIVLDENMTVLNVRGGEYRPLPALLLEQGYWSNAVKYMLDFNPKMKFVVVTDDLDYCKEIFPYTVAHMSIGFDYYLVNQARNLIISNSSFGLMPTFLNPFNPFVIAPQYWSRHNVSTGYWSSSNIWTFSEWHFLGRDGGLHHYE
jgi:hypothetical protein